MNEKINLALMIVGILIGLEAIYQICLSKVGITIHTIVGFILFAFCIAIVKIVKDIFPIEFDIKVKTFYYILELLKKEGYEEFNNCSIIAYDERTFKSEKDFLGVSSEIAVIRGTKKERNKLLKGYHKDQLKEYAEIYNVSYTFKDERHVLDVKEIAKSE